MIESHDVLPYDVTVLVDDEGLINGIRGASEQAVLARAKAAVEKLWQTYNG